MSAPGRWLLPGLLALAVATLAGCAAPSGGTGVPAGPGAASPVGSGSSPGGAPGAASAGAVSSGGANPDASVSAMAATARLDPCPPSRTALPATPDGLPDVTLACLGPAGSRTVRLAGLDGPAVVNVWASWCVPCRQEAPLIQQLHAQAGPRLLVLGVDFADAAPLALDFAATQGLHYPSVVSSTEQFPLPRWAPGLPLTLMIDAEGRIVDVQRGPFTTWAQLRDTVARRLGVVL